MLRTPWKRVVRHRRCPTCDGAGVLREDDEDLRLAGVYVWGRTDEDFRSWPTHWRG
ncbi:MAG: hypothetical protein KC621_31600 [Myxococcales bacterium]|nr:hypothetical protein [Myxococcales bacterium]